MGAGPQSEKENEEGVTSYRQLYKSDIFTCVLLVRARALPRGPPTSAPASEPCRPPG